VTTQTNQPQALAELVWAELAEVPDPELPVVSVVDLGVVRRVAVDGATVTVELLPTFVGCPAIELMRSAVAERLARVAERVEVTVTFAEPWTSGRISPEGRRKLREAGIAPPDGTAPGGGDGPLPLIPLIPVLAAVPCPSCGSSDTRLENPFGSTLCRAMHWCAACRQPFEEFKPV
jgi:ring-1,2-phenylacetyl-CoA epoxidase subunit PaaD